MKVYDTVANIVCIYAQCKKGNDCYFLPEHTVRREKKKEKKNILSFFKMVLNFSLYVSHIINEIKVAANDFCFIFSFFIYFSSKIYYYYKYIVIHTRLHFFKVFVSHSLCLFFSVGLLLS